MIVFKEDGPGNKYPCDKCLHNNVCRYQVEFKDLLNQGEYLTLQKIKLDCAEIKISCKFWKERPQPFPPFNPFAPIVNLPYKPNGMDIRYKSGEEIPLALQNVQNEIRVNQSEMLEVAEKEYERIYPLKANLKKIKEKREKKDGGFYG